jgi:membrane protein YqaA with SNARE-associated domain
VSSSPPSRPRGSTERPDAPGLRSAEEDEPRELDVPNLLLKTLLTFCVLLVGFFAAAYFFRPTLLELGHWFVDTFGPVGVSLAYAVPDALTLPIPADFVAGMAIMGDMSFASVVFWGSVGTLIGGSLGWVIGRFFVWRLPALRAYMARDKQVVPFLERRGGSVLAIAALTPLPYSLACWASGGIGMSFGTFFVISLLRIPRVGLYLWLVAEGVVMSGQLSGGVS